MSDWNFTNTGDETVSRILSDPHTKVRRVGAEWEVGTAVSGGPHTRVRNWATAQGTTIEDAARLLANTYSL